MNFLALVAFLSLAPAGHAQAADAYLNSYLIHTVKPAQDCVPLIQALVDRGGGAIVDVIPRFSFVAVAASEDDAQEIAKLPCVRSIRLEQKMYMRPRTGRAN